MEKNRGGVTLNEIHCCTRCYLNSFHVTGLSLYPHKIYDVFRGYWNRPAVWNRLISVPTSWLPNQVSWWRSQSYRNQYMIGISVTKDLTKTNRSKMFSRLSPNKSIGRNINNMTLFIRWHVVVAQLLAVYVVKRVHHVKIQQQQELVTLSCYYWVLSCLVWC